MKARIEALDRSIYISLSLLFAFVAFVPHRFIYSVGGGLIGETINLVPVLPAVVCSGLIGVVGLSWRLAPPIPASMLALIATALGLSLVSGLGSELPAYALKREAYHAVTGMLLLPVAMRAFRPKHRFALRILSIPAAVIGVICILEFAFGFRVWGDFFVSGSARYYQFAPVPFGPRVLGTVGHPVYLGSYATLILPIALWGAINEKHKPIGVFLIFWVVVGLLLTFSRGAWLGAIVGWLMYLSKRPRRQFWTMIGVTCALLFSLFSFERVRTTLVSRGTINQIQAFKTDRRGVAYLQATKILKTQPLLGVGTGLYHYASKRVGDYDSTPDNMYLRLLAERGVAGLVMMVALFTGVLFRIYVGRKTLLKLARFREADLCLAVMASLTGFLVDMITCDALQFPLTRISFWIVAGLGLAVSSRMDERTVVA